MRDEASAGDRRRLALSDDDIRRRREFVNLTADDITRITTLKGIVAAVADDLVDGFFDHLAGIEEARGLFADRHLLEEARKRKHEHLHAMTEGNYGRSYVEQRIALGTLYGSVGLDIRVFLGAFHHLLQKLGARVMAEHAGDPVMAFECFLSLEKLAFFDIGLIGDVLIEERERTIAAQQEAIRELSTPVLQVRDQLLILPLIGLIDTQRARQLTEDLLHAIRANRARVVVMDITGVAGVDSKVANHLLQTVAAARLMGTTMIVTGLSAEVAQALVALGVDLGRLTTLADLQSGLEAAERLLGYKVVRDRDSGSAV